MSFFFFPNDSMGVIFDNGFSKMGFSIPNKWAEKGLIVFEQLLEKEKRNPKCKQSEKDISVGGAKEISFLMVGKIKKKSQ